MKFQAIKNKVKNKLAISVYNRYYESYYIPSVVTEINYYDMTLQMINWFFNNYNSNNEI